MNRWLDCECDRNAQAAFVAAMQLEQRPGSEKARLTGTAATAPQWIKAALERATVMSS
jgi:hypothetical protein